MPKVKVRKNWILLILLSLAGLFFAFVALRPYSLFLLPWKSHVSTQGFTLKYPHNWVTSEDGSTFLIRDIIPQVKPGDIPDSNHKLSIYVVMLQNDFSVQASKVKESYLRLKSIGQPDSIILEKSLEIDGHEATLLTLDPNPGTTKGTLTQDLIINLGNEKSLWVEISFMYRTDLTGWQYKTHLKVLDSILKSIKIDQ